MAPTKFAGFDPMPIISNVPGEDQLYKVESDFSYTTTKGLKIAVREGFVTDVASVPRLFWRVIRPEGKHGPAAIIHDFLYQSELVSRDLADEIFLEAMDRLGVSALKRHTMHKLVRAFGWMVWREHTSKSVNNARKFGDISYVTEAVFA